MVEAKRVNREVERLKIYLPRDVVEPYRPVGKKVVIEMIPMR